jgi:UDP-N-acetylmuramoyl-L-alanyl-D-glutamate--2,6-diaminopimelate ligase
MAAATALYKMGISIEAIKYGIENVSGLEGRMEFIERYNNAKIFVDYAHTPDGLEKTLKEIKKITDKRLIVLFGCGGNREKEKRAKMGIIAGKYADFSILTSDNPRYEEPYSIIREIESGLRKVSLKYITIQNRYIATGYAIEMLKSGDVLLIAGKGCENYQEIMGVKTKYNDKESVKDIIAKIGLTGELI